MLTDNMIVRHEAALQNPMNSCTLVGSAGNITLVKSGDQSFTQKGRYGSIRNEVGGLQRKLIISFEPLKDGKLRESISLSRTYENPSVEGDFQTEIVTTSMIVVANSGFITPLQRINHLCECHALIGMGQADSASDGTGTIAYRVYVVREY